MKVDGLNRKSFFLKTKAPLHPHFVQSPVWILEVMQVVNFIMRVMEWQEVKNAVELNLLHLERCMIAFLMLILLMSPKVAKHNNCCNVVPSLNNPNQFKASTYVHINNI